MKLYSYTTGKLYESEGSFTITISEKPLAADVETDEDVIIDEKYVSREEAIDNAYQVMKEIAANEGVDEDDVECVETQDELVCTAPGYKKWTFKLNGTLDVSTNSNDIINQDDIEEQDDESYVEDVPYESVATRFSKYRKMFESDVVIKDDGKYTHINEKDETDDEDDNKKDGDEQKRNTKDSDDDEEEMKAIILTVKKGDEDACKDELIDAGISEEDITILDADEDDDNVDIRVEPSAAFELKDYLAGKGIDLEEKIGGEIVDDDEDDDDEKKEGDGDDELDDFDFDNLGDIFGADEDEEK